MPSIKSIKVSDKSGSARRTGTNDNRVFTSKTKLVIMPILASEALLHKTKNSSNKMLPAVSILDL